MRYCDRDGTRFVEDNDFESLKEWVASGCDVNYNYDDDFNALMTAALWGRTEMAQYLIEHGANVNASVFPGQTALLIAVEHQQKDVAEILLNAGADVNYIDRYGMTPLYYAVDVPAQRRSHRDNLTEEQENKRCLEIVELLLIHDAVPNLSGLQNGSTPLDCIKRRNSTEMINLFKQHNKFS